METAGHWPFTLLHSSVIYHGQVLTQWVDGIGLVLSISTLLRIDTSMWTYTKQPNTVLVVAEAMQWTPPNQGILQTRKNVLISGVKMHPNIVFGDSNVVPSIEVSLLQGFTQT